MSDNVTADIVVIGSGAAGLSMALTAAEGGAKVIVYEKQRALGGTSNFFEGTFAVESEMQRRKYINYSRDEAFLNIMEYSHWRANARLVRAFVNESAGTITWLQKNGVEFIDVITNLPDGPQTYHVVKGTGAELIKILATRAKEKGVNIKIGTPVKKILKSGNLISGVVVEENNEDVEVSAKVIMIASGGYANNKEWIKKYAGFDLGVNILPIGNVDKMGDGIRMAFEVGAADEGLGVLEIYRTGPFGPEFPPKNQIELLAIQPDLWVNQKGERFCNEGIAFYDTSVGNANARHKEGYTYSIFDDSIVQRVLERGIDRNVAIENFPGTKPTNFYKELQISLEKNTGDVFMANSIEELARQIGVVPSTLRATIEEYNHFCEKGHDDLFVKNPKYLWPLRGPKFYAVKARTVHLGTMGGIKINHNMEVLDKKDNVIPGLYAGGYDTGGMWGDSYPIQVATGASSAFALNSGRIAGKNALKYLGK